MNLGFSLWLRTLVLRFADLRRRGCVDLHGDLVVFGYCFGLPVD